MIDLIAVLAVIGITVWLNAEVRELRRRITDLEQRLKVAARSEPPGATAPVAAAAASPEPPPQAPQPAAPLPPVARPGGWSTGGRAPLPVAEAAAVPRRVPAAPATSAAPAASSGPRRDDGFSLAGLLRRNPFATAGVALLLLGFAYFFQSVEWSRIVPPAARIAIAWLAAIGLGFAGVRFAKRAPLWGQLAQGGAAAVAYLATYVALAAYLLFGAASGFVLFAAVSAVLVWRAWQEDSQLLAAVGFLGAYAAPVLALQGAAPLLLTLGYGLLITAAALAVSLRKGWLELAVYAHLCAASLAGLVYANRPPPLPAGLQQLVANAYFAQFLAWSWAWTRWRGVESASQGAVLSGALTVAVVAYMALQQWLLGAAAFGAAAVAVAILMVALGFLWRGLAILRETAWVLAALALAAAFSTQDLAPDLTAFLLYAEGSLVVLTTTGWTIRRGVGSLLVVAGSAALFVDAGGPWLLLLPVLSASALSMLRTSRALALLQAVVALALGFRLLGRLIDDPQVLAPVGFAANLAYTALALRIARTAVTPAAALYGMAAVATGLQFVAQRPGPHGVLHLAVLGAAAALALLAGPRLAASSATPVAQRIASLASRVVVTFLPALVAFKLGAGTVALIAWLALGVVGVAVLERAGWPRRPGTPAADTLPNRALPLCGLALGVATLLPIARSTPTHVLAGVALLLALLHAWRSDDLLGRGPRRVLCSALLLLGGRIWLRGWTGDVQDAWRTALDSEALCVLLAAAGVANLFVGSREGDRAGWMAATACCAAATVLLLRLVGGALASPLGVAGALLSLGVLFLVAGYLAPLPPTAQARRA